MNHYRAAIIGHTGHGNYGHGLDIAFMNFPNIEIVIANPDTTGHAKVQTLTGAPTTYADYRSLLEKERPNLVAIAPRFVGDRLAMVEAAAAVGACTSKNPSPPRLTPTPTPCWLHVNTPMSKWRLPTKGGCTRLRYTPCSWCNRGKSVACA